MKINDQEISNKKMKLITFFYINNSKMISVIKLNYKLN